MYFGSSEIRQRFTGYHAKAVPVFPSRGTRGPFLERPGNFSGPNTNIQIEI